MKKSKKILLFYILGTILTFWILVLIRKNYILFHDHFYLWRWRFILKTSIISGVPLGGAIWVYLAYKFPTISLDFNYFIILFKNYFIGILLAVATLEHTHILSAIAQWLDQTVGNQAIIVILIGLVSAVVDNVPLVAASMGMYSLEQYPTDSFLWQFLVYCAGTGGSILVIGSAAGVAAMGLERIDFFWYVKKISGLALIGYLAGAGAYMLQYNLTH